MPTLPSRDPLCPFRFAEKRASRSDDVSNLCSNRDAAARARGAAEPASTAVAAARRPLLSLHGVRRLGSALVAVAVAAGCSVPRTVIPPAPSPDSTPAPVPVESGFLSDYSKLQPSEQFPALKFWRDDARTGGYRRLHVRPVGVWRGADRRLEDVSDEDLQYLADALYRAVRDRLAGSFDVVEEPGPGVLDIHLGFTLVTEPDQNIDFFSTAVPVRHLARREGPLVESTRRFVRDSALEAEFSEVDRTAPAERGKSRRTVRAAFFDARRDADTPKGNVNTWEDVHAVFAKWAAVLDERLEALRDGTFRPRLTAGEE